VDETRDGDAEIGSRARKIRHRRGLSLDVVAEQVGIIKGYLSMLETGQRSFTRRGLVEDLAHVLGCSPADLSGTLAITPDRRTLLAASAIPGLTTALHDTTLDDVPDTPTRPVVELAPLADTALAESDQMRFDTVSGSVLGELVTELHIVAATGASAERDTALAALVEVSFLGMHLAASLGDHVLALLAIGRGWDAARRAGRPDLFGLMSMSRGIELNRVGARRRAISVVDGALSDLAAGPGPTLDDTRVTEARGMLHLSAAHLAARSGHISDSDTHLDAAADLARFTGERNHMRYHFGAANCAAWRLTVAVETDRGPEEAERFAQSNIDLSVLDSAARISSVHFDLARACAQAGGARDAEALRHIDRADRIAPRRTRQHPLTRELVADPDRRARRRVWELDSLRRRVGSVAEGSRLVNPSGRHGFTEGRWPPTRTPLTRWSSSCAARGAPPGLWPSTSTTAPAGALCAPPGRRPAECGGRARLRPQPAPRPRTPGDQGRGAVRGAGLCPRPHLPGRAWQRHRRPPTGRVRLRRDGGQWTTDVGRRTG
jgi:transcriptional regulator with XRE-family HTH domain